MTSPKTLKARLRAVTTEEGGRKHAIFTGYRPSFWWGDVSEPGREYHDAQIMLDSVQELAPGEEAIVTLRPLRPEYWRGLQAGTYLEVYEGARLVGTATIVEARLN